MSGLILLNLLIYLVIILRILVFIVYLYRYLKFIIMKTKHYVLFFLVSLAIPFLNSCYAFMKADKLVYAGTIAKRPVEIKVDSTFNTEVSTDAIDSSFEK